MLVKICQKRSVSAFLLGEGPGTQTFVGDDASSAGAHRAVDDAGGFGMLAGGAAGTTPSSTSTGRGRGRTQARTGKGASAAKRRGSSNPVF